MNWYIGQEIVCVKNHSDGYDVWFELTVGESYLVKGLKSCPCGCNHIYIAVGVTCVDPSDIFCEITESPLGEVVEGEQIFFTELYFAPLDTLDEQIKEAFTTSLPIPQ